jgi:2-phosphosulfolactate phosphatase
MNGTVLIDCFPQSAERHKSRCAIVAIDVIRATTTATTAVSAGRQVFPALTSDDAFVRAQTLEDPLLVGELGGNMPFGFHLTNSPAQIALRSDNRPMVLVSSSGTQLMLAAVGSESVYLACLRNYTAVARHIAARHAQVAVIGAGTRGQFRREDQVGCALVARELLELGYAPEDQQTLDCVERWTNRPMEVAVEAIRTGKSAAYLCKSGQMADLEFVLAHVDDLQTVPQLVAGELADVARSQTAAGKMAR